MQIFSFGDTVLVPFPFTDMPLAKRRPSVVLSFKSFNEANGQSIMGMITSAAASQWVGDIAIGNLAAAGLPLQSFIRFKLFTLPNELILRQLGTLAPPDLTRLRASMAGIFG